ncbi:MAG: hypothetical protein KTR29_17260 [Rhodothermaceae bacterium]|nr:hypothetical protein [Rhodothermaceae bacterium]
MAAVNQTNTHFPSGTVPFNSELIPPTYIAGIGASAGGIEALQSFFEQVKRNDNLAYVVIQHLSPHFRSLMVEILSKHTELSVRGIESEMPIRANHVYVAPPGKNISIAKGTLYTSVQDRSSGLLFPIDSFLESLAEDVKDKSIGIILSGTGSDGTHGGRLIKEAGGLLIAQEPASAKFSGMPRSVINTGLVDQVLGSTAIPGMLSHYTSFQRNMAEGEGEDAVTHSNLDRILHLLKSRYRIDFNNYKPTTLIRRIEHRMSVNLITCYEHYIEAGNAN